MTDFTASETNICNLALQQMGRSTRIASLAETTTEAGPICALQYPISRDAVLRAFPWNFAATRATLTAHAEAPDFEFDNYYKLPSDYLWLRKIIDAYDEPYKVERFSSSSSGVIKVIATNLGSPIYIIYTARVTEPTEFESLFIQTLAAHIAANIAIPLTETRAKANDLWQAYRAKLQEARSVDSQEDSADPFPQGSWVDGRFSGQIAPYRDFVP